MCKKNRYNLSRILTYTICHSNIFIQFSGKQYQVEYFLKIFERNEKTLVKWPWYDEMTEEPVAYIPDA